MKRQSTPHSESSSIGSEKISAIVATFNRAEYLGASLHSLLQQSHPCHEIVVVDDGSTDNTREVVAQFGGRVRYVYKENGGKSSAINLVLPEIVGDFVWFFDDDDVALPEANEVRLELFRMDPGCGLVFGSRIVARTDESQGALVPFYYSPVDVPEGRQGFHELLLGNYFFLSSALISRDCLANIGIFNEELIRTQDYEYLLRVARIYNIRNCGKHIYMFREHQGSRGSSKIRHAASERFKYFSKFDKMVGNWIRSEIALTELEGGSGEDGVRLSLLNRAAAMASKGMKDELLVDLRTAMEADETSPLNAREINYARAICGHQNYWSHIHGLKFLKDIAVLRRSVAGRGMLAQIAKAYYWKFSRRNTSLKDKFRLGLGLGYVFILAKAPYFDS